MRSAAVAAVGRVMSVVGIALFLSFAIAVGVLWPGSAQSTDTSSAPPACEVTVPNGSVPPGERWRGHGNDRLWTQLPGDGRLEALPPGSRGLPKLNPDGSISQKFLWLGRRTAKTPPPARIPFTITGQRLDARSKPFKKSGRGAGWNGEALYWPSILNFSSPGCWKVVGRAGKGTRLAFVISVELPSR